MLRVKKRTAAFGRYPACDMLNNAIRFLRNGDADHAMQAIIYVIAISNGYFHDDNWPIVEYTIDVLSDEIGIDRRPDRPMNRRRQ